MNSRCPLCQERPTSASCFVRWFGMESESCRMCWEQVFLDPRRVLDGLLERSGARGRSEVGSRGS